MDLWRLAHRRDRRLLAGRARERVRWVVRAPCAPRSSRRRSARRARHPRSPSLAGGRDRARRPTRRFSGCRRRKASGGRGFDGDVQPRTPTTSLSTGGPRGVPDASAVAKVLRAKGAERNRERANAGEHGRTPKQTSKRLDSASRDAVYWTVPTAGRQQEIDVAVTAKSGSGCAV